MPSRHTVHYSCLNHSSTLFSRLKGRRNDDDDVVMERLEEEEEEKEEEQKNRLRDAKCRKRGQETVHTKSADRTHRLSLSLSLSRTHSFSHASFSHHSHQVHWESVCQVACQVSFRWREFTLFVRTFLCCSSIFMTHHHLRGSLFQIEGCNVLLQHDMTTDKKGGEQVRKENAGHRACTPCLRAWYGSLGRINIVYENICLVTASSLSRTFNQIDIFMSLFTCFLRLNKEFVCRITQKYTVSVNESVMSQSWVRHMINWPLDHNDRPQETAMNAWHHISFMYSKDNTITTKVNPSKLHETHSVKLCFFSPPKSRSHTQWQKKKSFYATLTLQSNQVRKEINCTTRKKTWLSHKSHSRDSTTRIRRA